MAAAALECFVSIVAISFSSSLMYKCADRTQFQQNNFQTCTYQHAFPRQLPTQCLGALVTISTGLFPLSGPRIGGIM